MTVAQAEVERYLKAGRALVRILAGEKAPVGKWQNASPKAADFKPDDGIAWKCGAPSGDLVCIDLDAPQAIALGDQFLPNTGLIEGRPSKPQSHRWYQCVGARSESFADVDGTVLVEIRSTGGYAVVPPSRHASGEIRAWAQDAAPLAIAPDDLRSVVTYLAVAALLARHWPTAPGSRHALAGPVAGLLLRCGVPAVWVPRIIEQAARSAGDAEINDRITYARNTIAKHDKGEHVTGGPHVADILGRRVKSRICRFLGAADYGVIDELNQRWFICDVGAETVVGEEVAETNEEKTRRWTRFEFRSYRAFRDRLIKEPDVIVGHKPNGDPILKGRADYWLEHAEGRQYDRLIYVPDGSGIAVDMSKTPPDLNGWKGFTVQPAPGDWSKTRTFIRDVICDGNDDLNDWLLDWCADLFQRPGQHADTTPVLTGKQGIGKNFFFDKVLGWCFDGRHAASVVNMNGVLGDFNDRLSGLVLLVLDEVNLTPPQSIALRGLVTADALDINRKHIARARERSMLHIGILSNDAVPLHIASDDRRFAFFAVSNARANDHAYFAELLRELDERGGRAAMLHDLLARTYDRNRLRLAPMSDAKQTVKAGSLASQHSAIRHWLLREEHQGYLEVVREDLFQQLRGVKHQPDDPGWSNDSLGAVIKAVWPDLPSNSKRRVHGKERRTYKFGLVADARTQFDQALGISTDWPTSKMDDLVALAERESVNEYRKLGTDGQITNTAWGLVHLGATILRKIGVKTDALEEAEDRIRGVTTAPPLPL